MKAGFNIIQNKTLKDSLIVKVGDVEKICTECPLPLEKCKGNCKRFTEELEKLGVKDAKRVKRRNQKIF